MIGLTVALANVPFFDLVEASAFETTPGDLHIGTIDGGSVRLTKNLTDKISAELSLLHAGHGAAKNESRASLGFIYSSGKWTAWVEGIFLRGNEEFPDAGFSVTAGTSRVWGPGKVAVEAVYIQKSLAQIGLGYILQGTPHFSVGPEIRYTRTDNSADNLALGVRALFTFDTRR